MLHPTKPWTIIANMGNTGLFATWPGHNQDFFNRPFAPTLTHHERMSWIALGCLVIGFLSQMISNFL